MRQTTKVFIVLCTLGLLTANAAGEVTLRWKLAKGDTFQLTTTSQTQTTTTTVDQQGNRQNEKESEAEEVVRTVTVDDVGADGNIKLTMTIDSLKKEQVSKDKTMIFNARRGADGEPEVKVDIKSPNAALRGQDVRALMEKIAANMIELKMYFEITPQGVVLSAKGEGDPFADLPTDTQITRMIAQTVRKLISADDLPQLVAAEGFTQLAAGAVAVDDTWPLRRSFAVMGLEMDGKGQTKLVKLENNTATLEEKLTYNVKTDKFNKIIKEMTEGLMKELGVPATLTVDLKAGKDLEAVSTSTFNIAGGHIVTTSWDKLTIPFGGNMTVNVFGQDNKLTMDVSVEVTTKNTWMKK